MQLPAFSRAVSGRMGAAICHVLLWMTEFCDAIVSCFTLSRYTVFYGNIALTAGRLDHTIVQGNCLFKIMSQETCQ